MIAPYAVTKGGGTLAQQIRETLLTDKYGNWRALGEETMVRLAERLAGQELDEMVVSEIVAEKTGEYVFRIEELEAENRLLDSEISDLERVQNYSQLRP